MGAGKSTLGPELAERLGRPFVSVDAVVEERTGSTVAELFAKRGQEAFRALEERVAIEVLTRRLPEVVELGGGALGAERTRIALAEHAFTVLLETTPEQAWERVSPGDRPLAQDPEEFRTLFAERTPVYEAVADGHARDLDGVVLAAAGIHVWEGAVDGLGGIAPGAGSIELVVDAGVEPLYGERARRALGERLSAFHVLPAGGQGKSIDEAERLWSSLQPRSRGNGPGARWRLDDRPRGLRGGVVPPRGSLGRGADDARRHRWTRPSAGRPPSTSSEARTSSARFTGLRASSSTRSSWPRFRPRSSETVLPKW